MNWIQKILAGLEKASEVKSAFKAGHFYSPVVNPEELLSARETIWPSSPREIFGIDFNLQSHREILEVYFPKYIKNYDYPNSNLNDELSFYTNNSQFSGLDSRLLFVLMQACEVSRIIEVGSGYSSLLMADVNTRFLCGRCEITCIEPYPRDFLTRSVPGLTRLISQKVQDVPIDYFDDLESGDILFIDSSHVCKTGSDVNYLYFEILPRLKPGVIIHVHDIFFLVITRKNGL